MNRIMIKQMAPIQLDKRSFPASSAKTLFNAEWFYIHKQT